MNIETINKSLHRPIKSGVQYNKYFSKVPCKATVLGNGDTTFTLQLMKQWVEKYGHQTKEIAKVLAGRNVPETINNVYKFLYNHIQYSADGLTQDLLSPACSWQRRSQGIDCKSYSLMALSILQNLDIKAKFRKIIQPNSPDTWSHVYVVIDYQGKEYVIDATKHQNTQGSYIKKEDMQVSLPHRGLNAVDPTTERDAEMMAAINNFKNYFLPSLESQGVSKIVTNKILNEVKASLLEGIDPIIKINDSNMVVNKIVIPFGTGSQGLGFVISGAAVATAAKGIDWGKALGSFTKIFGGGGTSLEDMMKHSSNVIQSITKKFQNSFGNNPSQALTTFNKDIHHLIAQTTLGLENASSSKSKQSGESNLQQAKDFLNKFSQIEKEISKDFNISKTTKTSFYDFKRKEYYDYNVYTLTPKGQGSNKNMNFGFPANQPQNGSANTSTGTNFFDGLIQIANGLLKNPQTGQILTQQQAQQQGFKVQGNQMPVTQNGMSTTTKIAIAGGGLVLLGGTLYVLRKKNII